MSDFIIPPFRIISPNRDAALRAVVQSVGLGGVQILNGKQNPYSGSNDLLPTYTKDDPIATSILGTPIYTDLTLFGVNYTDYNGNFIELRNDRTRNNKTSSVDNGRNNRKSAFYQNLDTVLITVTQPIRVIKTEIQGRDGTVKEYIGKDDATITVNGIITGKNGVYPRDEVYRLTAWLSAPVTKSILAWWLGNLGIENVVITEFTIPQNAGEYSQQAFSFTAISDTPAELRVTIPVT